MRDFIATIKALVLFIVIALITALFLPSTRSIIFDFLGLFGSIFEIFYLEDFIWKSAILILILVAGSFLCIKKREQRLLWGVLTSVASIITTYFLIK